MCTLYCSRYLKSFLTCKEQQKLVIRRLTSISQVMVAKQVNEFSRVVSRFSPAFVVLYSTEENSEKKSEKVDSTNRRGGSNKKINTGYTVFINGRNFDYDVPYLKDLFSQFGKVEKVVIPPSLVTLENQYQHAFVKFEDFESYKKALQARRIDSKPGSTLFIKKRSVPQRTRTYMISDLPADITISQLVNHFEQFCDIELINLFLNRYSTTYPDFAYMVLKKELDVIIDRKHIIGDHLISVTKSNIENLRRNRCQSIFLEGLPDDIAEEEIYSYFKSFGEIEDVYLMPAKRLNERSGLAKVRFAKQEFASSATESLLHEINGAVINVRALGYFTR